QSADVAYDRDIMLGVNTKRAPVRRTADRDRLLHALIRLIYRRLRQIRDSLGQIAPGPLAEWLAIPGDITLAAQMAEEQLNESRLAAAVGPEQRDDLAGVERYRYGVDDGL